MATTPWSIPAGKAITGSTLIKDTDNNISDTIDDLVAWTNSTGVHAGTGLSEDFVDVSTAQSIAGIKTFSDELIASSGLTGNVTGSLTGEADTAVTLGVGDDRTKLDGIEASATEDQTDAEIKTAYENNADTNGVTDAEKALLGTTSSVTELDYSTGVTSAIQTQLDAKAPLSSPALTDVPTAPTAAADTNTTQIATTAFVQQEITTGSGVWLYTSSDVVVPTSAGKTQSAHGLGFVPNSVNIVMKCISIDDGYEVGDEIPLGTEINSSGRGTVWFNATYVGISVTSSIQFLSRTNRETGANATLTSTKWKLVFKAR